MCVNWTYKGKVISSLEDFNLDSKPEGFIYSIELEDGSKYIGKKNFFSKRKKHFGKKKLAEVTDKRKKTYEYIIKESDWLKYISSNKEIKKLISEGVSYKKEILQIAYSKGDLTYLETRYLFVNDVLKNKNYLNDNILGKFYRKNLL